MATDPVRRIRRTEHDTPIELNLPDLLLDLAALPASTAATWLTISLDWSADGSQPGRVPTADPKPSQRRADTGPDSVSNRPARTILTSELERIITALPERSETRASLEADRDKVVAWLDTELDPSISGAFIVACSAHDHFEAIPLGLALETRVSTGPTPDLSLLAQLIDDHPTYAVLVADQVDAVLTLYVQGTAASEISVESSGYPRKQSSGGLNQRRYKARANERINAFARVVAQELQSVAEEHAIDRIVLAGDEVIMSALKPELHQSLSDRIIDTIRLDMTASDAEIRAAAEPLVAAAEREEERTVVQHLADRIGSDNRAVAGIDGVLRALQQGGVQTLILADDLEGTGWGDFTLDIYGSGDIPAEHPTGGNPANLVALDLDEELIRLAVNTGAEIQIIHTVPEHAPESGQPNRSEAAIALDQFSGAGALLRFDM